jgi:2-polyprenyl-3-methyl-5-hydroxy-6-metoxy-1,4-benzoquinol methylase
MPTYTHGHHEAVLRSHSSRTAENSAAYLLPRLRPGLSLLDIGCGPGTITADLAGLVAPGTVTAVEPTVEALALAERTAADRQVPNIRFETADVHALNYADDSFDVVHAHQVLQHLHDPVLALREMRRVCAPDGVVAARDADYAAMTWYPQVPALDDWLSVYRRTARHNGGEPDAGRRMLSWAQAAGFAEIVSTASVWCYATPEERQWWSGMWADRIVDSAIAEQAVSYGYATRGDLERISAGWREWGAATDGWFAILHAELLCRPGPATPRK